MKKITIILISFLLVSCGSSNVINDMQTLEQKALEIPPNFELKPPSDNENIQNEETISDEIGSSDLDEILSSENDVIEDVNNNSDNDLLDILITDSESSSE
jgi:uncharacterized protein YcfL